MDKIFIGITAFNEPELKQTIDNCMDMADYPERLNFGIHAHYTNNKAPSFEDYENVQIVHSVYPYMMGCGLGRLNANFFHTDEKYYLQIDAHMLFQKGWDTKVINRLEKIKSTASHKPIISNYVPWWSANEDGSINFYEPEEDRHDVIIKYADHENDHTYPMQDGYVIEWDGREFVEHHSISGHFIFTHSTFLQEISSDPDILYSGEEPLLALRAWTRGYRIFAIPDPITWHKNKGHGYIHPDDRVLEHEKPEKYKKFIEKDNYSSLKTRRLLTGEEFGYWGAPSQSHLRNYEKAANISFKDFYRRVDRANGYNV